MSERKQAVTLKTLADQDWKTQLARGYRNIPIDTLVDVINEEFINFYGTWCEVEWEGRHYYVDKKDLSFNIIDISMATKSSGKSEEI